MAVHPVRHEQRRPAQDVAAVGGLPVRRQPRQFPGQLLAVGVAFGEEELELELVAQPHGLVPPVGRIAQEHEFGDGPVDAIYSAIQRLTGIKASLIDYRIRAVSKGKDAQGEVTIELEHSGRTIRGRGLSTDILEASALAYLAAINRLRTLSNRERLVTQHTGV